MKKFMALVLATLATVSVMSFASCNKDANYVATPIESNENEQYGLAIGKNASKKTEYLAAMNKVIADFDIDTAISYYTALSNDETPTVTVTLPDLSDNTAGTLKMYTEATFAPFEYINNDQEVDGVDVYLMSLVAEELNMKLDVSDIAFDAILGKVKSEDNAIGAAGMTIDATRLEEVDFSDPYFSTVQCIISAEDQAFSNLEDLKGKKIGVQKGTTGWKLIDEAITSGVLKDTGATVIPYENGAVAFTALKSGKCDAVVIDELPAKKLVK